MARPSRSGNFQVACRMGLSRRGRTPSRTSNDPANATGFNPIHRLTKAAMTNCLERLDAKCVNGPTVLRQCLWAYRRGTITPGVESTAAPATTTFRDTPCLSKQCHLTSSSRSNGLTSFALRVDQSGPLKRFSKLIGNRHVMHRVFPTLKQVTAILLPELLG